MKLIYNSWNRLLHDCVLVMFVCGTIGIALKFATFFNHWVFFPSFPNSLDSTFLVSAVIYLAWRAIKRK
jgi:hypothetical protein